MNQRSKIQVQFGTGKAEAYPFSPDDSPNADDCDWNGEIYVFNDIGYRHKCILGYPGSLMEQCKGVPVGWTHTDLWHIEQWKTDTLLRRITAAIHGEAPLARTP